MQFNYGNKLRISEMKRIADVRLQPPRPHAICPCGDGLVVPTFSLVVPQYVLGNCEHQLDQVMNTNHLEKLVASFQCERHAALVVHRHLPGVSIAVNTRST